MDPVSRGWLAFIGFCPMEMMHLPPPDSRSRNRICIIVAGMHRSGTSATTRVVNLLGADITKDLMPPAAGNNDRGFWEPIRIVEIHDRLLRALESSFDDPFPLPEDWMRTKPAQQAIRELTDEIERDFAESELFVVKDPRISRLLPLWLDALDDLSIEPIIVIPVRNPLEVAASLKKRDEFSLSKSLLMYLRSYLDTELASRGRRRLFVSYNQLLFDWNLFAGRLRRLADGRMRPLRADSIIEINDFLSRDLYHNRFTYSQLSNAVDIPPIVVEVFQRMKNAAETGSQHQLEQVFDRLRKRVDEATKLFHELFIYERERARGEVGRLQTEQQIARQDLINDIEKLRTEICSANSRSNDLHAALSTQSGEAARLSERLLTAHNRINTLDSEIARLSREFSAVQIRNGELSSQVEIHSARATQSNSELEEMRKRLGQLQTELTDDHKQIENLTTLLASATRELQGIKFGLGWRIMAPIRWLSDRFRTYSNIKLIMGSSLFDKRWYLDRYPDVADQKVKPALHFLRRGAAEGRDPSALFDSDWYLQQNPDVRAADINPLIHYLRYGAREGRDPHPNFDTKWYIDKYLKGQKARVNPLVHYATVGKAVGYQANASNASCGVGNVAVDSR
jgi:hypothetical protein